MPPAVSRLIRSNKMAVARLNGRSILSSSMCQLLGETQTSILVGQTLPIICQLRSPTGKPGGFVKSALIVLDKQPDVGVQPPRLRRNYEVLRSFLNTCALKYRIEGGTPALENDIGHPLHRWPPHVTKIFSIRTSSSGRTRLPEESRVQTRPSRDPPEDCQAAPQACRWQFPQQVFDSPN